MEALSPPLKKIRPDLFPNGNGPYPSSFPDLDRKRPPDSFGSFPDSGRYRPLEPLSSERESLSTGLGSKSKACLKFFSTSGCPYGEGCHFAHYMPGGLASLGLSQASNLSGAGAVGARKPLTAPTGLSSSLVSPLEQGSVRGGYKSRLCKNFDTSEGCRFADKCHFAHGEKELRNPNGSTQAAERSLDRFSSPLGRTAIGSLEDKLSLRGFREPTPPGLAAAASFGAVSTAKISIDASLAGLIIGKGGINAKSICRLTGAKLSIRDHESDSTLRNIEMEGSFDQIKQASAMVRELLVHKDATPMKPGGFGSHNFKTKMCDNYMKGSCTFGDRCHFAHGPSEMREASSV